MYSRGIDQFIKIAATSLIFYNLTSHAGRSSQAAAASAADPFILYVQRQV